MDEAPERIWAWIDYDGNWDGTWLAHSEHIEPHRLPDAEYRRADLHATLTAERDALRKALQLIAVMGYSDDPAVSSGIARYAVDGARAALDATKDQRG